MQKALVSVKVDKQIQRGTNPWGKLLDALADPYRRQLLVAMLEENPQDDDDIDPLNELSISQADAELLQTRLDHIHLPKLEELGYIHWDKESGELSKGPHWGEIAPLLELVQNHQDELPDGWL